MYAGYLLFSLGFELGVATCGVWAKLGERGERGCSDEGAFDEGPLCVADAVEHLARINRLTAREGEVLALLAGGIGLEELAQRLGITLSTARVHARNIHDKLGVCSNEELAALIGRTRLGVTREQRAAAEAAPPPRRRGRPRKLGPQG